MARGDRESELEAWLEARGVTDAWEYTPTLVNLNYDTAQLARLAGHFGADRLPAVIAWLDATYRVSSLLHEMAQGAGRISEIVTALKSYSYLDQAPVQDVDVHEGLDNTLVILRHKLVSDITVRRDYAPDLPRIQACGGDLNQVWTNIIDNAADALDGRGQIIIRTRQDSDWVVVEIEDNGPGIPPEIQPRLFDPFFTTKPPGQGTGLGLDITYNIVVHRHRGDIKVISQPGKTCFQVRLPINFETLNP
jgi:signal transduction histidine kinase